MKEIVALLTCCAMVYHYTVGDCFHAHCQSPTTVPASVAMDGHHHSWGEHCHQHAEEGVAEHRTPDEPDVPPCPHDDFHDSHGAATLAGNSSYSHWDAAKVPLAVLDGPIVVACEKLGSAEPFCRDLAHDYHARTRGDCYRGLGAFLS